MASAGAQILVVEDDATQREILVYNLRKQGYEVRFAADGDEAAVGGRLPGFLPRIQSPRLAHARRPMPSLAR